MWVWISVATAIAVGFPGWILVRRFGAGRLEAFNEQRRATFLGGNVPRAVTAS
jgi:hypothetical protein